MKCVIKRLSKISSQDGWKRESGDVTWGLGTSPLRLPGDEPEPADMHGRPDRVGTVCTKNVPVRGPGHTSRILMHWIHCGKDWSHYRDPLGAIILKEVM